MPSGPANQKRGKEINSSFASAAASDPTVQVIAAKRGMSYEKALELQEAKIKEAFAVAFEAGRQQGAAAAIAAPSQSGGIKSATLKDGSSTLTSLSELAPPPSSSSAINITTASERFDDGDEDTYAWNGGGVSELKEMGVRTVKSASGVEMIGPASRTPKIDKIDLVQSDSALREGFLDLIPAVHKIKSILQIPTHVKFSDFLFSSGWSWVIFSMICTYFTAILLFATLLSFGKYGITGCWKNIPEPGPADEFGEPTWIPSRGQPAWADDDGDPHWGCDDVFMHSWHLSVQTFTTIGYGSLQPVSPYAHFIIACEGFASLFFASVVGGGIFLKLIKPIPRIVFSDKICIFQKSSSDHPRLRFRSIMSKKFQMYYTTSRLKVHLIIRNEAGKFVGLKTVPLTLIEDEHGMLSSASSYTHVIDSNSPLTGLTSANITEHVAKFSLIVQGDESMGFMTTYSGRTWTAKDVFYGHTFKNCYKANPEDPEGLGTYEADKIHDIEACNKTAATRRSFQLGELTKQASKTSDASMYFGFENND